MNQEPLQPPMKSGLIKSSSPVPKIDDDQDLGIAKAKVSGAEEEDIEMQLETPTNFRLDPQQQELCDEFKDDPAATTLDSSSFQPAPQPSSPLSVKQGSDSEEHPNNEVHMETVQECEEAPKQSEDEE